MKFTSLASSSHGNAYIVSDRETRILLECGLSRKKLQQLAGFKLTAFDACIVSHEHKDHSGCVADLIKAGLPVYMSLGTAEALGVELVTTIQHGEQFMVGSIDVVPFTTFHDAAEPLGFLFKSRCDGDVLAFATKRNMPVVIATTAHTPEEQQAIEAASKVIPIFKSANMSVAVNVLIDLCSKAAAVSSMLHSRTPQMAAIAFWRGDT